MKRERIQNKFKATLVQARTGAAGQRRAAEASLKGMVAVYPWLRDYAALLGDTEFAGVAHVTKDFPWLKPSEKASPKKAATKLPAKRRQAKAPMGAPPTQQTDKSCATGWIKPPTPAGYEYRQCYKPFCRCMRGGAWHGPYRYGKTRDGATVRSLYMKTTGA
jgi:hypothetical protein